jgi:hypothetical protein
MADIHSRVAGQLQTILNSAQADRLNEALRYLAKYRSLLIQNAIIAAEGVTVPDGPARIIASYANREVGWSEGCWI